MISPPVLFFPTWVVVTHPETSIPALTNASLARSRAARYVIIGGGPTTPTVRDYVRADAWTLDPKEGVNWCKRFLKDGGE